MDLLAEYSDSSEEASGPPTQNDANKRRTRPVELPDAARSLGAQPAPLVDAQGKRRRFEHVDNRLPCSVYLEAPTDAAHSAVYGSYVRAAARACACDADGLRPLYQAANGPKRELAPHVSLSRVFTLRRVQADEVVEALRGALRDSGSVDAALEGGRLFVNEDRSRSFVGLLLSEGTGEVLDLITAVDGVLRRFGKPAFYDPPEPHASVAWAPGDISERLLPQPPSRRAAAVEGRKEEEPGSDDDGGPLCDGSEADSEAPAATPAVPVTLSPADVVRLERLGSSAAAGAIRSGSSDGVASLRVAWSVRHVCVKVAGSVTRIPFGQSQHPTGGR
jgi:2'-5' RNA ligase